MNRLSTFTFSFLAFIFLFLHAPVAWAYVPRDGQMTLQEAVTPVMHGIHNFYEFVLLIMLIVVVFVWAVLIYIIFRFNRRANPVPSKRSHHTWLEVVWTIVPILIVLVIAIPSYKLLYAELILPQTDLTVKVTAHQWYWTYEYPDEGNVSFDSNIVKDKDLKPGQSRLFSVDNPLVVPIHKRVRVIITSSDVIHSFSVPSFGVKVDAVPGRLNETWFNVEKEGVYYGQCSQLCGTLHGFMPIEVRAVREGEFKKWLEQAKKDNA